MFVRVSAVGLLVLGLAVGPSAAAQAHGGAPPSADDCLNERRYPDPMQARICVNAAYDVEDARLNRAYKAAMARMPTAQRRIALRDAQRAWIKARDAECYDDWPGAGAKLEMASCYYDRASLRADALERMARR